MSRRWRYPRVARGRIRWVPPAPAVIPQPRTSRGARAALGLRRGRFFPVPALPTIAPPPPAPVFIQQPGPPRIAATARRARFFAFPPTTDEPPPQFLRLRRLAVLPSRRGATSEPPWPVSTPTPPPFIPAPVRHAAVQRLALTVRRGRFLPVVPAQVVAPPAYPPQWVHARVRVAYARRGRFFGLPVGAEQPPQALRARRGVTLPVRRGRVSQPPWPQVAATPPPPYVPALTRIRVRLLALRPGSFWQPPWPQAVPPAAPAWVPVVLRPRMPRPLICRRGRFGSALPADAAPPPASRARRPGVPASRRGVFTRPVPAEGAPQRPPSRPRSAPIVRRGRFAQPPWPQAVPAPPPDFVPGMMRPQRRIGLLARRGRIGQVWPITVTPTPTTTRGSMEPRDRRVSGMAGTSRRGAHMTGLSGGD